MQNNSLKEVVIILERIQRGIELRAFLTEEDKHIYKSDLQQAIDILQDIAHESEENYIGG